jgi:mannosyltransferase OCH1-like enzyme
LDVLGASRRRLFLFLLISGLFVFAFIVNRSVSYENINTNSTFSLTWNTGKCKHVSVDELDQWFHSKTWNEIPKIIHQSWKNQTLRQRQARWSQTWCDQYTDWRYHLWTDDENEHFVETKFPWFYPTFKQLSPTILKADSVRYLYMLYYGGIYVRYLFFRIKTK